MSVSFHKHRRGRQDARRVGLLWRRWRAFRSSLSHAIPLGLHPRRSLIVRVRRDIRALLASDLESASRSRAHELARNYLAADARKRMLFLRVLSREFGPLTAVNHPSDPPRLIVLRRIAELPDGLRLMMLLRGDLIDAARGDASMKVVEQELHRLLAAYFNIDLLEHRRVTWDSPAPVLEKLIEHEAVHEIRGWDDLRNRLDIDRRCYALFHPRMPDEPLVFVEIALCNGVAGDIHELLDESAPVGDPRAADTAVFYSISNCHKGLAGTSLGHFLITRAIDELRAELPALKVFVTLSPIPGFANWLRTALARDALPILSAQERAQLDELRNPKWFDDHAIADKLRGPLMRLAACYLLRVRRRDGRRAADAVAHFHLRNGARIERLNWLADRSEKGMHQSYGIMVNYRYEPSDLARNSEAYNRDGAIAASCEIEAEADSLKIGGPPDMNVVRPQS